MSYKVVLYARIPEWDASKSSPIDIHYAYPKTQSTYFPVSVPFEDFGDDYIAAKKVADLLNKENDYPKVPKPEDTSTIPITEIPSQYAFKFLVVSSEEERVNIKGWVARSNIGEYPASPYNGWYWNNVPISAAIEICKFYNDNHPPRNDDISTYPQFYTFTV